MEVVYTTEYGYPRGSKYNELMIWRGYGAARKYVQSKMEPHAGHCEFTIKEVPGLSFEVWVKTSQGESVLSMFIKRHEIQDT